MHALRRPLLAVALLAGCSSAAAQATTAPSDAAEAAHHAAPAKAAQAQAAPAPAASHPPPTLDPARGAEIGMIFEAYLSPHQEPDEEANTPSGTPAVFQSTEPSLSRAQREAAGHRGHGQIRFSKDLSRAFVDVRVEGVDPRSVNMFHIHCGKPGILGPILVDFALATDLQSNLADGLFTVEITNDLIVRTAEHGHGPIAAFTAGCLIPSASLSGKPTKVSTVAGMAQIALEGELYFNLHTRGQTFYGDIRGQVHRAEPR